MNPAIDAFISEAPQWQPELKALRRIVLDCGLTEELKWGQPCYTHKGHNIIILGGFKAHCRLMFVNGSLLKDPQNLLQKPGEHTQAGRYIPFTSVKEIKALQPELTRLIHDAIANEKAGVKPEYKTTSEPFPEELETKLSKDPALEEAFTALTPGRRRAYLLHFNAAKQSATRASRIEACRPRILAGKGIHDCICGHSKKFPACDGSHKSFPGDFKCP
ncbi:DUF1801 domain-containing protein [Prosthecobacter sp.]|uniref:DUF1801 domain-containing protein n=1 Tax=Prosthecobacter sp. TaxID=1965333 RepID=UPI0037833FF5